MTDDCSDAGKMDELCLLFSETLRSLSSDAAAIRQLTAMAKVTGVNDMANGEIENIHPNQDAQAVIRDLRILSDAVSSIEEKVETLREFVKEEKRALTDLETRRAEAEMQEAVLDKMIEVCRVSYMQSQYHDPQLAGNVHSQSNTTNKSRQRSTSLERKHAMQNRRRDSFDPRSSWTEPEPEPDHYNHDHEGNEISIPRVSDSELRSISRNIRGRISLIAINEAIDEIERVCRQKYAALPKGNKTGVASLERRYEYLKQQRANMDLQVEAHSGYQWVSEQELRESCAFFRLGESTARATLSILCTLKRLKQVPGKNVGVTYICLSETS